MSYQIAASEGQITDEIQEFVPNAFVFKSQFVIDRSVFAKHQKILRRNAFPQAHGDQLIGLLLEHEGATGREFLAEYVWCDRQFERLATDVVVVTSRWHAPRAAAAFRWYLRDSGATIVTASPPHRGGTRKWLGETMRWAVLPVQLAMHRRRSARQAAR